MNLVPSPGFPGTGFCSASNTVVIVLVITGGILQIVGILLATSQLYGLWMQLLARIGVFKPETRAEAEPAEVSAQAYGAQVNPTADDRVAALEREQARLEAKLANGLRSASEDAIKRVQSLSDGLREEATKKAPFVALGFLAIVIGSVLLILAGVDAATTPGYVRCVVPIAG